MNSIIEHSIPFSFILASRPEQHIRQAFDIKVLSSLTTGWSWMISTNQSSTFGCSYNPNSRITRIDIRAQALLLALARRSRKTSTKIFRPIHLCFDVECPASNLFHSEAQADPDEWVMILTNEHIGICYFVPADEI